MPFLINGSAAEAIFGCRFRARRCDCSVALNYSYADLGERTCRIVKGKTAGRLHGCDTGSEGPVATSASAVHVAGRKCVPAVGRNRKLDLLMPLLMALQVNPDFLPLVEYANIVAVRVSP